VDDFREERRARGAAGSQARLDLTRVKSSKKRGITVPFEDHSTEHSSDLGQGSRVNKPDPPVSLPEPGFGAMTVP
jgi:hypothetical protein